MTTSEQINDIAAALAKAQGAMRPAIKDSENPHYRAKYADLAANVEAARKPLADNGLAVLQEATLTDRGVSVATLLTHSSGQWIRFDPLTVPCAKSDAHGVGSATSYARRYALGAALGLVADDDDGNAAAAVGPQSRRTPAARPMELTNELPSEPPAPADFADWYADLQAVADEGSAALKQAWTKSRADLRKYMTTYHALQWEAIKAKAATVRVTA